MIPKYDDSLREIFYLVIPFFSHYCTQRIAMNYLFYFGERLYRTNFKVYYSLYSFYKKITDRHERRLISQLIKPGAVVLDVGANIGFYSVYFSGLAGGNGMVHCFEPDDLNFEHLKELTKNLSNVRLNKKAVTDSSQPLKLYKSHRLNVDHRTYPVDEYETSYEVQATSIDQYVNGKYKVYFIKMDIQGAEYPALKGMKETLFANPDIVLLMELAPPVLKEAGASVRAIFEFIHSLDFKLFDFNSKEITGVDVSKYDAYTRDQFENVIVSKRPPLLKR